jgi:hypothetical protein
MVQQRAGFDLYSWVGCQICRRWKLVCQDDLGDGLAIQLAASQQGAGQTGTNKTSAASDQ